MHRYRSVIHALTFRIPASSPRSRISYVGGRIPGGSGSASRLTHAASMPTRCAPSTSMSARSPTKSASSGPTASRSRAAARPHASSRRAPRSTPRGKPGAHAPRGSHGRGPRWSAPSARSAGSPASAHGRSEPACRRGRRGPPRTPSERLPARVPLVEAVPVADVSLAVLPAQVDLAAIAQVRKVYEPAPDVLRLAPDLDDLRERVLHPFRPLLDALGVGAPLRSVEAATARERAPVLLGLELPAECGRLRMRRHDLPHDPPEPADQRPPLARREVAVSHGSPSRRR